MVAHSGTTGQPTPDTVEQQIREAMVADDWERVAELEPLLNKLLPPKTQPSLLTAAMWYATQGLHIFPLRPKAKIPYAGSQGFKDATNDPQQIEQWWTDRPDSNIGIATGHIVDVIDIDGAEGVISWARLQNVPPILGVVSTPRPGGNHLYIAATGRGNKAAMVPKVDYRGQGGYVVAPPSVNDASIHYTWRRRLTLPPDEAVE